MKVLNFGSLNVDYVYQVPHMVAAGETLLSHALQVFAGGKGLNQSIALARAGVPVQHAGLVGEDSRILLDTCREYGVDAELVRQIPGKGGHTIIQVDETGQNCILLYGGTNQMQTEAYVEEVLQGFGEGDCLLLQNEINLLPYIIERAYAKGMRIFLNPSPMNEKLSVCDLTKISLFLLNEVEGEQLTGTAEPMEILTALQDRYPQAAFVLTLGSRGAYYLDGAQEGMQPVFQDIFPVKAVDTTAAGDTFTGYFIEGMLHGRGPAESLRRAALASSIAVSRPGAAPSIPSVEEIMQLCAN